MQDDQLFILDKWIKSFLNEKKTLELSKNTIMNYKRVLDSFYEFYSLKEEKNEIFSIYDINRDFIVEYLNYKGDISTNTKNLHITVIKSFLAYISKYNKEKINLISKIDDLSAKRVKSESESLSDHESRVLENYLDEKRYKKNFLNIRNRLLLKLLYHTGIRASELLQIRVSDFTFLESEGVYKIYILGKGSKYRYVYIPTQLIEDELEYITNSFYSSDIKVNCKSCNIENYIAVTQKLRVMSRTELYLMIERVFKKLHINKKGVHLLRHTFGKRMVKKNVNLSTIKELMGHENIQTTMIYARSDEKAMISAIIM